MYYFLVAFATLWCIFIHCASLEAYVVSLKSCRQATLCGHEPLCYQNEESLCMVQCASEDLGMSLIFGAVYCRFPQDVPLFCSIM